MNGKFIYVFDEYVKNELVKDGYNLMFVKNGIYVFENKPNASFSANNVRCVYSDTLTF